MIILLNWFFNNDYWKYSYQYDWGNKLKIHIFDQFDIKHRIDRISPYHYFIFFNSRMKIGLVFYFLDYYQLILKVTLKILTIPQLPFISDFL